ncbi:smg-9, nonsense mediated mRNA decay factor, partial [Nowakowskiella sp. JEL0078]
MSLNSNSVSVSDSFPVSRTPSRNSTSPAVKVLYRRSVVPEVIEKPTTVTMLKREEIEKNGVRDRRIDDDWEKKNRRKGRKERMPKDSSGPSTLYSQTPVILERRQVVAANADGLTQQVADNLKSVQDVPLTPVKSQADIVTDYANRISSQILKLSSEPPQWYGLKPKNSEPIKMMDEKQKIQIDQVFRVLNDQPGCFIVGVLGRRGVGKSTVISSFSHNQFTKNDSHETLGIDMYITSERIILLDTQPIFSRSALDRIKRSTDVVVPENFAKNPDKWLELNALQMTMFMFSVCHVLIIVTDSANDSELYSFLRKVEKLKFADASSNQLPNHQNSQTTTSSSLHLSRQTLNNDSSKEDEEYFPEIVFVVNKAGPNDFTPISVSQISKNIHDAFSDSQISISGILSTSYLLPSPHSVSPFADILGNRSLDTSGGIPPIISDVNLVILPRTLGKRSGSLDKLGISISELTLYDDIRESQKWPARSH